MPTEDSLLSTPAGYATPEQLAASREYAKALLYGKGQQEPIRHWTQGVSNMVSALVGGYDLYKAGQQERGSQLFDANRLPRDVGDTTESVSAPAKGGAASVRTNNPGAQWPGPVSKQFGSTSFQPVAAGNKIAVFDDPVKGGAAQFSLLDRKYSGLPLQVAINRWSTGNDQGNANSAAYAAKVAKAAGLSPNAVLTPQLLRSPQGIAMAKAMADWEAGGTYPMSDEQWRAAHALAFSGGKGGQPMAFNGQPTGGPPVASDASGGTPMALAGGKVPMALSGAPTTVPPGRVSQEQGQTFIPPELVPHRIPVTREEFVNTMASPYVSPEMKTFTAQSYYGQRQPQDIATTGGRVVVGGGKQMYIPELQKGTFKGPQGIEVPYFGTITPQQTLKFMQGEGGTPTPSAPRSPPPPNVPDLQYAPTEGNGGFPGMLGAAPPGGLPPEITTGRSAPKDEGAPAPQKTAQLGGTPQQMLDSLMKMGLDYEGKKTQIDKDAESFQKRYDTLADVGTKAAITMPDLQIAREMLEDPKFYSGPAADPIIDWKRLKSVIGGDPKAAAANEVFDKVISGNIVKDLGVELQKLGQVRIAEIDLLKKAAANRYNTIPANRAVLELMMRAHQQLNDVSKITNAYSQGVRWDAKGKVVRGPDGQPVIHDERPTTAGLDAAIKQYVEQHPIAKPEEIKNYEKLFDNDIKRFGKTPTAKAGKGKAAPKAQTPTIPGLPPGAVLE